MILPTRPLKMFKIEPQIKEVLMPPLRNIQRNTKNTEQAEYHQQLES